MNKSGVSSYCTKFQHIYQKKTYFILVLVKFSHFQILCNDMKGFCSLTPDGYFIRSLSNQTAYIYPSCQKIRKVSAHLAKEGEEGYDGEF